MISIKKISEGSESWKKIDDVFRKSSVDVKYLVLGASSISEAVSAVVDYSPSDIGDVSLSEVRFDSFLADGISSGANIVASYEFLSSSGGGGSDNDSAEPTVSFDCGGGTMHVTRSLYQRRIKGTKDPKGAVGWDGKDNVAGVDIPTAQLRETYTRVMSLSQITNNFKRKVASLVGCVNSSSFNGWNAGEVMFLGMSYSTPTKGAKKVVVTFNFAIQVNESSVTIGDKTFSKKGYEYVWAISSPRVEGNALTNETTDIFVDRVCKYASFSGLGL